MISVSSCFMLFARSSTKEKQKLVYTDHSQTTHSKQVISNPQKLKRKKIDFDSHLMLQRIQQEFKDSWALLPSDQVFENNPFFKYLSLRSKELANIAQFTEYLVSLVLLKLLNSKKQNRSGEIILSDQDINELNMLMFSLKKEPLKDLIRIKLPMYSNNILFVFLIIASSLCKDARILHALCVSWSEKYFDFLIDLLETYLPICLENHVSNYVYRKLHVVIQNDHFYLSSGDNELFQVDKKKLDTVVRYSFFYKLISKGFFVI
jgi:hypothetical protein